MHEINSKLNELKDKKSILKPIFFDLSIKEDCDKINLLVGEGKIQHISDDFEEQQNELFAINNPSQVYAPGFKEKFQEYYNNLQKSKPLYECGTWVFFPWISKLIHILEEADFYRVRTARNRNLISEDEQKKFYDATIGIGGLSVGSSVALALVLQGGPKHIKLADMDRLALSNTNRVLSGVDNLGVLKVEMAAKKIYEINPYSNIELFPNGLTRESIDEFFNGLDIVVDELDNLAIKYLIREKAKQYKIPVLMAADNGDNAVVDIERYDLDPETPFFQGRLGDTSYEELANLDKFGIGKTITKHIGPENITERMQQSLLEMGKTIVSWPQLGGAALINGAAVAYCARKILNGQKVENNRSLISMDEKLIPDYNSKEEVEKRDKISASFKQMFGL